MDGMEMVPAPGVSPTCLPKGSDNAASVGPDRDNKPHQVGLTSLPWNIFYPDLFPAQMGLY